MGSEIVGGVIAVIICVAVIVIASKKRTGNSDSEGDREK